MVEFVFILMISLGGEQAAYLATYSSEVQCKQAAQQFKKDNKWRHARPICYKILKPSEE